jgi:hypothetical protein
MPAPLGRLVRPYLVEAAAPDGDMTAGAGADAYSGAGGGIAFGSAGAAGTAGTAGAAGSAGAVGTADTGCAPLSLRRWARPEAGFGASAAASTGPAPDAA